MLELYYYKNSVCSERVLMTLSEKEQRQWVSHHIDLFKGQQHRESYQKLNPKNQVPTLVHHGQVVRESSIICEYLDDLSAQNSLKPTDRIDMARMREWIKESDENGFQGVAALSFVAVFREKLLARTPRERDSMWRQQTDFGRTQRQKSCVEHGLESPYAVLALHIWEQIFRSMESNLADNRKWLIGDQFTLADINFAPLVARLEALQLLPLWIEHRPFCLDWWQRIKSRSSYSDAHVGPGVGEETAEYAREGLRIRKQVSQLLEQINNSAG